MHPVVVLNRVSSFTKTTTKSPLPSLCPTPPPTTYARRKKEGKEGTEGKERTRGRKEVVLWIIWKTEGTETKREKKEKKRTTPARRKHQK